MINFHRTKPAAVVILPSSIFHVQFALENHCWPKGVGIDPNLPHR
jgi:hypothetical protein